MRGDRLGKSAADELTTRAGLRCFVCGRNSCSCTPVQSGAMGFGRTGRPPDDGDAAGRELFAPGAIGLFRPGARARLCPAGRVDEFLMFLADWSEMDMV